MGRVAGGETAMGRGVGGGVVVWNGATRDGSGTGTDSNGNMCHAYGEWGGE